MVERALISHDLANKSATIRDRKLHKLQEKLIDFLTLMLSPEMNEWLLSVSGLLFSFVYSSLQVFL